MSEGLRAMTAGKNSELYDSGLPTEQPYYPDVDRVDGIYLWSRGQRYVNCASNDYLGLARHGEVAGSCIDGLLSWGGGLVGSPVACGVAEPVNLLSKQIAQSMGTDRSILFPSGYQACVGIVQALAAVDSSFVCDKGVHASIVDGVRMGGKMTRYFNHNDSHALTEKLRLIRKRSSGMVSVIVEDIYGVQGEPADIEGIVDACLNYDATLVVDASHSIGFLSDPDRYGAFIKERPDAFVFVAALSKAIGWVGGVVCTSEGLHRAVLENSRSLLFSASIQPHAALAVATSLRFAEREPWRARLAMQAVETVLARLGPQPRLRFFGSLPILTLELGSVEGALRAWRRIRDSGVLATAFIPPGVPSENPLVRFSFGPNHFEEACMAKVVEAIKRVAWV